MIYTLTLNPALDYTLYTENLVLDNVNRSRKEEFSFGGKGINVSIILKRLNVASTALGFIAGFTGKELERLLQDEKIITDFVRLKTGITRINIKLKDNNETEINALGPNVDDEEFDMLLKKIDGIKANDMLCISGSVPKSFSSDIYENIIERISEKNIKLIVDAEGDLLLKTLKYRPFLIKPNHHELGAIFSREMNSIDEIVKYAAELRKMGAENVLVSRAGEGAVLLDADNKQYIVSAPEGTVISSVGAGDSMVAGFIAAIENGLEMKKALRLSIACGSATAFSSGLANTEKIATLYKKTKIF